MKRVGFAVVGCGAVAEKFHLACIERVPEVEVVALVDKNQARAEEMKKIFSLKNAIVLQDYHQALEMTNVGAVMVLTPPTTHAQVAIDAANAGKHVFCEKPMTTNVNDAKRMIAAVKSAGVRLMVGFNFRFQPQYVKAKELVVKGLIGRPSMANAWLTVDLSLRPTVSRSLYKSEEGGGVLFDTGCHLVDLLRWMLGEVISVCAKTDSTFLRLSVDDAASAFLEFESGVCGFMHTNWASPDYNGLMIVGSEGILWANTNEPSVALMRKGLIEQPPIEIPVQVILPSFGSELAHFARCILQRKEPAVTGQDGLKAIQVVLAAYESAQKDSKIQVNYQ